MENFCSNILVNTFAKNNTQKHKLCHQVNRQIILKPFFKKELMVKRILKNLNSPMSCDMVMVLGCCLVGFKLLVIGCYRYINNGYLFISKFKMDMHEN